MKKNNYILCFTLALLFSWAVPSVAAPLECTLEKNALQDSWIQKRTFELSALESETGNTQILSLFKLSINAKDNYIQRSCQWRYMLKQPNAQQAVVTYKECEIAMTEQFIQQLKTAL